MRHISKNMPRKYNETDLKHRQRFLMLTDLCIAANLLLSWALPGGNSFMLALGMIALILAIVSRIDRREEMNGNVRVAEVTILFIAVSVFLTLYRRFFCIVGLTETLFLGLFAFWPYRKRLCHKRKKH